MGYAISHDTQIENGLEESFDSMALHVRFPAGLIVFQELAGPAVEESRAVDGSDDFTVAFDKGFLVHFRDEIDGSVGVVTSNIEAEPVFRL